MTKVMVTIDTEEDDWGRYDAAGQSVGNIAELPRLQRLFDQYGVRPTYFVNRPPLLDSRSVEVLKEIAADPSCEIGTHCHPWNTPPLSPSKPPGSTMMCSFSREANRAKIGEVSHLISERLKVSPTSFRAGRWGFGPTVASVLPELDYEVDSSVSPFLDWSRLGGPDYSAAPMTPYRFNPREPLRPAPEGCLVEVPTTVAALWGHPVRQARTRALLEKTFVARLGLIGLTDRLGLFARRWLSPETSSAEELVRLAKRVDGHGYGVMGLTFHSCTLLPGATPFVRDIADRAAFLGRIEAFLEYVRSRGWSFATVADVGREVRKGPRP